MFHKQDHVILHDFPFSHLRAFNSLINSIDFDIIYSKSDINEKIQLFYGHLTNALKIISKKRISLTHKDKKWVTPLLKSLITDRWNAFRCKNFEKYNHLKVKVKSEKSKKFYHKKLISKGSNALNKNLLCTIHFHSTLKTLTRR